MTRKIIGAQGEITIIKIDALPEGVATEPVGWTPLGYIISHSESGNHHVLTGGEVMERVSDVPEGMQVLYALLDTPGSLVQDAPVPHEGYTLEPGIYELRIAREYDPFAEQARRVTD